jgi:hypothetical protein
MYPFWEATAGVGGCGCYDESLYIIHHTHTHTALPNRCLEFVREYFFAWANYLKENIDHKRKTNTPSRSRELNNSPEKQR